MSIDDSDGRRTVKDSQIIEELRAAEDGYLTAPELADRLGITRQGMYRRLVDLEERGIVEQQKLNPSAGIWKLVN